MRNKLSLLLFLVFCIAVHGQEKYSFDYMLEYSLKKTATSKIEKSYILTNSKDNSYTLRIEENDSLNFVFNFLDQNGYRSTTYNSKANFFKADIINVECKFVSRFVNPFKYQTKNYDFINLSDTLIEGNQYSHYILKSNKPKQVKKLKLGVLHYIIEKETSNHLPILAFPTAYEEWKLEKNIPNGIPKEMYFEKQEGIVNQNFYKLIQITKIDKQLTITGGCDFSTPYVNGVSIYDQNSKYEK